MVVKHKKSMCNLALVFYLLVIIFIGATALFLIPALREYTNFPIMVIFGFAFIVLGIALIFLTKKRKVKGPLRKTLILTGASPACFTIFVLLHNLFYALGMITSNIIILNYLMNALHVLFFLLAVFVCPLGFLAGMVGSIILFIRRK